MNPTISQQTVDEALEDDEVSARSEWLGLWRHDVESFIGADALEAVTIPGRTELPPIGSASHFAFCDPAGGTGRDSFCATVGHREGDRVVQDVLIEIRPPFDPDAAVQEIAGVLRRYGVSSVTGDRYAGAWPTSRFQAHGITYRPAEMVRSDLYRNALPVITAKRCELLDDARMRRQWLSLDRTISRTGLERIDANGGRRQDDAANVTAGLLCMASRARTVAGTVKLTGF
ncbi:MAG: hypothetical protein ACREJO_18970 [Phycisphaerales bacterium]